MTDPHASVKSEDPALTVEYLLRRMRQKSDFPALASSMTRIQSLSLSDTESLHTLSEEILKDVALTQKLLRVVNAARFRSAGVDPISTVSRAVMLVGLAGIRNVALSLMLVEHMEDKQHARQLKEEFLRTVMAGTIASELSTTPRQSEEAFVMALFRNLGRLLVEYYLPEDAQQIRDQARAPGQSAPEEDVSHAVLGLSFDELGQAVGKDWGLPPEIVKGMRAPQTAWPRGAIKDPADRLSWMATLSCDVARVMLLTEPAELGVQLQALEAQAATALELGRDTVSQAAFRARTRLTELVEALEFQVDRGEPSERLVDTYYVDAPHADDAPPAVSPDALGLGDGFGEAQAREEDAASILASGIQDVASTLVGDFKLPDVLHMILETVLRAFDCHRVVFCLRDPRGNALMGRMALGDGGEAVKGLFGVPLESGGSPHIFSAVCLKGTDLLIRDASAPAVRDRLPLWFRQKVDAPTFLLLPLIMQRQGKPHIMGLIYADRLVADSLKVDAQHLTQLTALRNQAILAFKQSASNGR